MAVQDRITQVGIAKQSAKAAEADTATFQVGVTSGEVATLEITEEDLDVTWASRVLEGHDRTVVTPGASYETLAMPRSIGLFLALALGEETVTGSGPYEHTFRPGLALPYATLFARKASEYFKVGDARLSEIALTWETTGALRASVTFMGCTYTFLSDAYTADEDERPSGGVLKGAGATFEVDGQPAIVRGGTITINNSVAPIHGSNSALPADVFPEIVTCDVSLTIVPEDLALFRRVVTGSDSGSAVQPRPQYGAVKASWRVDDDTDLTFHGDNVKFLCAFPSTNARGGPIEVTLEGSCSTPAGGGDAFRFVLRNDVDDTY